MWRLATIGLTALLVIALVPALRHLRETPPPLPPPARLSLEPPVDTEFGAGDTSFDAAVAPSGREVVFAATTRGEVQLWRRALESDRAEVLAGTSGGTMPAFAPDGAAVWFFAGGKLRQLNLSTRDVREVADAPTPAGVSVRADGSLLYAPSASGPVKQLVDGRMSDATTLHEGERAHVFPEWTIDGRAFVYLAIRDDGRRVVRVNDGARDVDVTRADSHAVLIDDYLLCVRDGTLVAEPFDPESRRVHDRAHSLAFNVGVSPSGRGAFAVGGHLLATARSTRRARVLQWFADDGQPLDVVSEPGDYWQLRLSPDERTVAVTMMDPLLRTLDVFTMPAAGGPLTRVTLALAADTDPVWSPDGRRLAFRSLQEGQPQIYARPVAGRAAQDEPLHQSPLDEVPTDWTQNFLFFHARSPSSGFDVWAAPPGNAEPRAVARSGFNEIDARISPDGHRLAYASDESGQFDVYVANVSDAQIRTRISTAGGTKPQWVAGPALVFLRGTEVMRVDIAVNADRLTASTPRRLLALPGLRDIAVRRDGRRLLAVVSTRATADNLMNVVVHWRALVGLERIN